MADLRPSAAIPADASWSQLEAIVERLHRAAREDQSPREFYGQLLGDACAVTGASSGAAWHRGGRASLELIAERHEDRAASVGQRIVAERREAVKRALAESLGDFVLVDDGAGGVDLVICPIPSATLGGRETIGALELSFSPGADAVVRQSRGDLLATLAAVAVDYHAFSELRALRATADVQRQAVDLLRRLQQPRELEEAGFAVAHEARRLLGCDRVTVVVRRHERWRLLAVSGASRADRQSEFARLAERLAADAANWGEPITHDSGRAAGIELPPRLESSLAEHLDASHARQLAVVPLSYATAADAGGEASGESSHDALSGSRFDAVLIAEQFDGAAGEGWQRQLIEVGELSAPSLARAAALDRLPVRLALDWSERLTALRRPLARRRAAWIAALIVAALATLTFAPATLTVEAPATLSAAVEREVFASATGSVAEIRVVHGQQVREGEVLIVLSDPELSLKIQQVSGELAASRERLQSLAVARTDRTLRDRATEDRLPLSAEQRQLEERAAALEAQLSLLQERREALALRSPIDGEVLTPDVHSLLTSRPVERGEALLTVADASSGWKLKAQVSQRDVGAVVEALASAASRQPPGSVLAEYRLSGDVAATYDARVVGVNAAAPLEAEGLDDATPPIEVLLAVEGDPPAAARPGMAAAVRIDCGRRSLGYVWLHDVAATAYRWLMF